MVIALSFFHSSCTFLLFDLLVYRIYFDYKAALMIK